MVSVRVRKPTAGRWLLTLSQHAHTQSRAYEIV